MTSDLDPGRSAVAVMINMIQSEADNIAQQLETHAERIRLAAKRYNTTPDGRAKGGHPDDGDVHGD